MIANKLDMYGIVSYRKEQLSVYWLCWSYPCHHGNFMNTTTVDQKGQPWCQEGLPWCQEGLPWGQEGQPWCQEGVPWCQEGLT